MGEKTKIAWTDATFNIAWGCVKVSPGCAHCYAEELATKRDPNKLWGPGSARRTFGAAHWREPVKWDAKARQEGIRRKVFSSSMCDVFEDHPTIAQERKRLWALVRETPFLEWQLLTKRPENLLLPGYLPDDWGPGYPNVWLGTSIENADYAFRRDQLVEVPAAIRFVSYEPALGPLAEALDLDGIDWVIYGGESGPGYRKHDLDWPRRMRIACEKAGVAFFYKQSSAARTEMGIELDGKIVREFPHNRRVAR